VSVSFAPQVAKKGLIGDFPLGEWKSRFPFRSAVVSVNTATLLAPMKFI
jgi:hypothetical protein